MRIIDCSSMQIFIKSIIFSLETIFEYISSITEFSMRANEATKIMKNLFV